MIANKPGILAVGSAALTWRVAELARCAEGCEVQQQRLARLTPGELARCLCSSSKRCGRHSGLRGPGAQWGCGCGCGCGRVELLWHEVPPPPPADDQLEGQPCCVCRLLAAGAAPAGPPPRARRRGRPWPLAGGQPLKAAPPPRPAPPRRFARFEQLRELGLLEGRLPKPSFILSMSATAFGQNLVHWQQRAASGRACSGEAEAEEAEEQGLFHARRESEGVDMADVADMAMMTWGRLQGGRLVAA
jgi:hypothetical protein